jgi:hypothetical protein
MKQHMMREELLVLFNMHTGKIHINMKTVVVVQVQMHNYWLICIVSDIYLHRDKNLMPQNPAAWSAWNFLGSNNNKVCVTYWLNILQVGYIALKMH